MTNPENLGSDEPATESAVDSTAGDDAGAAPSGGANPPDGEGVKTSISDAKPSVSDVKKADAAMDATQAVQDYAETKRA